MPLNAHSVPEGQPDRSLARSAWDHAPRKDRPVGYGVIVHRLARIPDLGFRRLHLLGAFTSFGGGSCDRSVAGRSHRSEMV
jgi:hypothetical protein